MSRELGLGQLETRLVPLYRLRYVNVINDMTTLSTDPATFVAQVRAKAGLSQRELAERAGTSQPAIARLEGGGTDPSLSTLQRIIAAAGFELRLAIDPLPAPDAVIEAYKSGVDRTLLRENLRKSMDQRLMDIQAFHESAAALQQAVSDQQKRRQRPQRRPGPKGRS